MTDIANYVDDAVPYVSGEIISTVVASLKRSAILMFNWFHNQMKGSEVKCHALLKTDETLQVKNGAALINSSKCEKLLGVDIVSQRLMSTLVYAKKTSAKLNALSRLARHMRPEL